jgi:acetate kinase
LLSGCVTHALQITAICASFASCQKAKFLRYSCIINLLTTPKVNRLLAINAGSTSLKFALYTSSLRETHAGSIDWAQGGLGRSHFQIRSLNGKIFQDTLSLANGKAAAAFAIEYLASKHSICAVGHRIVHGGTRFHASQLIDRSVKETIAELSEIAPLHNPPALAGIEAAEKALPGIPQIAVFDAFYP